MPRKGATVDLIDLYKRAKKGDDQAHFELQQHTKKKYRNAAPADPSSRRTRRKINHVQGVTHGRRHCSRCSGWLYVTAFKAKQWTNSQRVLPKVLYGECESCLREVEGLRDLQKREEEAQQKRIRKEASGVIAIIKRMSREEFTEYELEGVLPILPRGVVMEDLDPTPVPTGCPECWRRDGSLACDSCPDPQTKEKRRIYLREVKQQGLALPV